jgi:hypothetical protein
MRAIPFELLPGMLCVALVNPLSVKTVEAIEHLTSRHVRRFASSHDQIMVAIERVYGIREE